MKKIVIDPVTRIEGHLRMEAALDDANRVSEAWSSGTMFRGIEKILLGRDPREAWIWTQRICGVCTTVHALTSVRAVEDALGIQVPDNARLLRNLIAGTQMVQDHVVHFYHLHALDWVDVTLALKADPKATSRLAESLSEYSNSSPGRFKAVQERAGALVASGKLSLFASGYWGHPAYTLPPEVNLLAVSHYLDALDWQREIIRIHAVLGGKNPHLQSYLVGGMTTAMDRDEAMAPLNLQRLALIREEVQKAKQFVEQVYLPDVLAIAGFYPDWFSRGEGTGNFLTYGCYPEGDLADPSSYFFPQGVLLGRDLTKVHPFAPDKVKEYVTHSYYEDDEGRHPSQGETKPRYSGPTPPFEHLETEGKYSWLKSPRYDDRPMEVGPLARVLMGYASGRKEFVEVVDGALAALKAPATALFSTLGRVAARALETKLMVNQLEKWVNALEVNLERGDLRVHDGAMWDPASWPREAQGFGWHEAPRGALGHWVHIEDKAIKNYQCVVPTTWNGSPRDAKGQPGPYEASLVGHALADPERPVELLRTVHSFDPCVACAVHVVDGRRRNPQVLVKGG